MPKNSKGNRGSPLRKFPRSFSKERHPGRILPIRPQGNHPPPRANRRNRLKRNADQHQLQELGLHRIMPKSHLPDRKGRANNAEIYRHGLGTDPNRDQRQNREAQQVPTKSCQFQG